MRRKWRSLAVSTENSSERAVAPINRSAYGTMEPAIMASAPIFAAKSAASRVKGYMFSWETRSARKVWRRKRFGLSPIDTVRKFRIPNGREGGLLVA